MRREFIIFIVLLSVFLATGCADTGDEDTEPTEAVTPGGEPVTPAEAVTPTVEPQPLSEGAIIEVAIQNSNYEPATVTISTGDTVRWTNMDNVDHTATGETFDSDTIEPGESFEFLFTDAGTYDYYCSVHPSMKGTVIVEENNE